MVFRGEKQKNGNWRYSWASNNSYFFCLTFSLNLRQLALYPMKTPEAQSQEYVSPALRIIPLITENAICDSTIPGGNEDIGYEDWD